MIFFFLVLKCQYISVHVSKLISTNHKSKEALEKKNWLVRKYYEIYPLFAYCCVGAEVFYLLLYLLHFLPESKLLFWVS